MDPIKNVGVADYAMVAPQAQANQVEDYSTMPMVYEPQQAPKGKKGVGMLGASLIGLAALTGGVMIGKKNGAKALKDAAIKVQEAEANYAKVAKENEILLKAKEEAVESLNKSRDGNIFKRFWRTFNPTAGMTDAEKEAFNAYKEAQKAAEKAAKEAKKANKGDKAKEVADKAKDAVEETTK